MQTPFNWGRIVFSTKINLKHIKDLNVRLKTIKILQVNIGSKRSYISHSNNVSDISSQARETKNGQIGLHQTKTVLHSQGNCQQNEKTTHQWENIFANHTSDKGFICKIYKEFIKFNTPQKIQLKNGAKDLNRHLSKEDIQMAKRHEKMLNVTNHQRNAD